MNLGLFVMPLHPPMRQIGETYKENVEKVVLADQLGFEEVWVGEHFSATTEPISAPFIFLSSLIPQTKRIKLCTGVVNLPNHNPAIVAAEAALFDHMSEGRFIFGIGPGGLASDYELFDNEDPHVRAEKMIESYETIIKIWSQDPPYDIHGKYYNVRIAKAIMPELGVGFIAKPYQKPFPPIGLSAMSPFSSSVKMAAMKGWQPVSANFIPEQSVASHWQKYLEGCEAAKREPDGNDWRVARNVIIAPTDEEARERAFDPEGSNYYFFRYVYDVLVRSDYAMAIKPDPTVPDSEVTIESLIDKLVVYGSPKTVTEKLRAFRERVGPFGTLLMAAMDWSGVNRERERETMRLLSEQVRPNLAELSKVA